MNKINLSGVIRILFAAVFLLAGCATAKKKPQAGSIPIAPKQEVTAKKAIAKPEQLSLPEKKAEEKLSDDVQTFLNLQELDLDNDGASEIIAVYVNSANVNCVKVIKTIAGNKGTVLFKESFPVSDIKLDIKGRLPILTVKKIDSATGRKSDKTYHWDGKAFICE